MKKLFYILLLAVLFHSCKMQYRIDADIPYSVFKKNYKYGVINTTTKQIIIPAKFDGLEQHHILKEDFSDYPPKQEQIFYEAYLTNENSLLYDKGFLYDGKGKLLYTFGVGENQRALFYHNKRLYLITETIIFTEDDRNPMQSYGYKLIRIGTTSAERLLTATLIERKGKNMIRFSSRSYQDFGYFDLNTDKKIIFEDFRSSIYIKSKNEVWAKTYDKETRIDNPYYDIIVDSTLTVKSNPISNVKEIYQDYFFTETKKGLQPMDYNGNVFPFSYPYLKPLRFIIPNGFRKEKFDDLLIFSAHQQGVIKGIINTNGNIILPEKFNQIDVKEIYYPTSASEEFKNFVKENNLQEYYYFTTKNDREEKEYTVFNKEGKEIIKTNSHGVQSKCWVQFDVASTEPIITFTCSDSTRTYNLKTKQLIRSEAKKRGY